ncbi:MAG: CAAX prenyl protease-related protein [Kiritimatiellaeota bacterium]|nr:CAAX prenyl protease-related protein [Kiritimatiellota bacterium]
MRWAFKKTAAAGSAPAPGSENRRAVISHAVPFGAWLAIMMLLDVPALPPGWRYTLQTVVCAGLFIVLRPWRWYAPLNVRNLPLALVIGVLVYLVWVGPESAWMKSHNPVIYDFYQKMFAVQPWFEVPKPPKIWQFAPEVCGWPLSLVRLAGSACVIAVIEEFFFRGFIYRFIVADDFLRLDVGYFHPAIFFLVNVMFGFEHGQWLAGIFAGLAFGFVMIITRDIWAAACSHAITNYLLGLYVLATGNYHFW